MENREINLNKDIPNARKNLKFSEKEQWDKIVDSSFVVLIAEEIGNSNSMVEVQRAKQAMETIEANYGHRPKILLIFRTQSIANSLMEALKQCGVNTDEDVESTAVSFADWYGARELFLAT